MRALFLAALLLIGAQASAEKPDLADAANWTAGEYNDYLVSEEFVVVRELFDTLGRIPQIETPTQFEAWRKELETVIDASLEHLRALPAFKGDSALRDVLVEGFAWLQHRVENEIAEMWKLSLKADVSNADLARMEVLVAEVDTEGQKLDDKLRTVQAEFAERNNVLLIEADDMPEPDTGPQFTAPDLIPEGSRLEAEQHVSFAMRYHNQIVESQTRVMEALNTWFEATNGDASKLDQVREAQLHIIRTERDWADHVTDWQGDDSLRKAYLVFVRAIETDLEGPGSQFAKLLNKKRITQGDADVINGLGTKSNELVQRELNAFGEALGVFQARWGMLAYQAWLEQQGKLPAE